MENTGDIKKVEVPLPIPEDRGKLAFILYNVFTKEECDEWIALTEKSGYSEALVNVGSGQVSMPNFRNSDRCIIDDVEMADKLFQRIKSYLPETWKDYQLVGLNERLRFLRYDPGQKFAPHLDGVYARPDGSGERSFITIQLYLNEGYEGGETTFVSFGSGGKRYACKPETGMVLVFQHALYHEGSLLKAGRKYTVRTDVMYKP